MSASSPGNEQEAPTTIPGRSPPDTQYRRGIPFDHPDVRSNESQTRESGAARSRWLSGRAMAMLAVSPLFAALLVACGGESQQPSPEGTGNTRAAARDAIPAIIPTEVSTTVPTETPVRSDTRRNRERTPVSGTSRASIPTRVPEPTRVSGSREPAEPAEPAAPTEPPAPTQPPAATELPAPTRQAAPTEPAPTPTLPRRPQISAAGAAGWPFWARWAWTWTRAGRSRRSS